MKNKKEEKIIKEIKMKKDKYIKNELLEWENSKSNLKSKNKENEEKYKKNELLEWDDLEPDPVTIEQIKNFENERKSRLAEKKICIKEKEIEISDEERRINAEKRMEEEMRKSYGDRFYEFNKILEKGDFVDMYNHALTYWKEYEGVILVTNEHYQEWKDNMKIFTNDADYCLFMEIIRKYDYEFFDYIMKQDYRNREKEIDIITKNHKYPKLNPMRKKEKIVNYSARYGKNVVFDEVERIQMNEGNCLTFLESRFSEKIEPNNNCYNPLFNFLLCEEESLKTRYKFFIRSTLHYLILKRNYIKGRYISIYNDEFKNIMNKFIKTYGIKINRIFVSKKEKIKMIKNII